MQAYRTASGDKQEMSGTTARFQQAFPTATTVSLWHLGPTVPATSDLRLVHASTKAPVASEPVVSDAHGRLAPGATPAFGASRITFGGLTPDTEYAVISPDGSELTRLRTAPAASAPDRLSFLVTSCNNPFTSSSKTDHSKISQDKLNSLRLFGARASGELKIEGWPRPAFWIGLGDQVYVDGDNKHGERLALFRGNRSRPVFDLRDSHELLDIVYREHFTMQYFEQALRSLPAAFIWDDHDVRDGFGAASNRDDSLAPYYREAREAFLAYQWLRGPNANKPAPPGPLDVSFGWGKDVRTMLVDTRTSDASDVAWAEQLCAVDSFFRNGTDPSQPTLFVLGLPAPLTIASAPRSEILKDFVHQVKCETKDDLEDAWAYKEPRRRALLRVLQEYFMTHRKHRLLILSGDVHFSGINYLSTGTGSRFHDGLGKDGTFRPRCDEWVRGNAPAARKLPDSFEPQRLACAGGYPDKLDKRSTEERTRGRKHLDEDVLWGWEVISSGLANSEEIGTLKTMAAMAGTIDDKCDEASFYSGGDALVTAHPRGSIYNSPSFAEIMVKKDAGQLGVSVAFYPSVFRGKDVNQPGHVSVADGPLPLYEYQSVSGSKDANCACDGAKERQVTAVPLDWSCLPETRTGKNLYNCVHACSSMGRKSSEADAGEQIER